MIVVCVDLEDDVLAVPASEVVKLVHAAAGDHLCWSVWRFVELKVCGTADSAMFDRWLIGVIEFGGLW